MAAQNSAGAIAIPNTPGNTASRDASVWNPQALPPFSYFSKTFHYEEENTHHTGESRIGGDEYYVRDDHSHTGTSTSS
jgi:hypothetical protein